MSKHIVLITNEYDQPLNILVNFPFVGDDNWKTLDKGIWRYNQGACSLYDKTRYTKLIDPTNADAVRSHKHLILCNTPMLSSGAGGVVFYDFKGWTSVNESGVGLLRSNYSLASVIQFQFQWKVVD